MEDPITARRLSPAEAESFFAEGVDARTAAPGSQPGISYTHARTFPKCECGGIAVPNASGDITRTCIRCGAIVRSQATLIEQPERSFEIAPCAGGWMLTLWKCGVDAGGGFFPDDDGMGYSAAFEMASDWIAAHQPEQVQGSPTCPGGTGAAGPSQPPAGEAAGGPENQADGFAAESELRCTDCRRLRHATPRHAPDCRYAFQNCPGCVYAGQGHIVSCPIASQLKLPTDNCCEGVDLPSIGHVHAPDCRNTRPVLRASHALPAETATPTPQELAGREGLFGQLLFAARDLALYRVMAPIAFAKGFCTECGGSISRELAEHTRTCKTGRVLDLVARICAVSPMFAPEATGNGGAR